MNYLHRCENIKVCPGCGTNLINTAKHCAACGYSFTDVDIQPLKDEGRTHGRRQMQVTLNLPVLLGLLILLLAINALVILGFQNRDRTKVLIAAGQATGTYIATTYVSPTPSSTMTSTPGPPTATPVVYIEYVVVSGDSCLSIADHFNIYLDSLLAKNEIDCAQLNIGTVLRILPPTPTPESTSTAAGTLAP